MAFNDSLSLYIPHIFGNYTKEYVAKTFDDLNIGKVKYIDFVQKMSNNGAIYNAAYIHFEYWYTNVIARNFQSRVLDTTKEARLMYEDPWYWIVLENKSNKVVPGARKPRINVPNAPKKAKMVNSDRDFDDICRQIARDFGDEYMMEDLEACIKEDDKHLISIDGRYVQTLEKENRDYLDYIAEMQHKMNILIDENMCLNGEIEIIKEQFVVPLSFKNGV